MTANSAISTRSSSPAMDGGHGMDRLRSGCRPRGGISLHPTSSCIMWNNISIYHRLRSSAQSFVAVRHRRLCRTLEQKWSMRRGDDELVNDSRHIEESFITVHPRSSLHDASPQNPISILESLEMKVPATTPVTNKAGLPRKLVENVRVVPREPGPWMRCGIACAPPWPYARRMKLVPGIVPKDAPPSVAEFPTGIAYMR
jgi:hypothetical protein